ncbi:MAG: beta-ketoacyl-[acyl-carrier-protein] synthase family protein [Planctomycetota bacterium]|jgi:3-oxoacyl-[acyl-carrier-protein] synthase II|nr:beta-ketoacyl-[acyl-carrier-protein] synthase family protein [Planctomycetota bacterium]
MPNFPRIVATGVGLTSPLGNDLKTMRENLLAGRPNVREHELRYVGKVLAGICDFDATKHQSKKNARRGTRAGSIAVFCAGDALAAAGVELADPSRVGVYVGITEHGNVETENEIAAIKEHDYDVKLWTHHHNPRTVANNPAGEVCLNLGLTGAHCCLGAACAAGNYGVIHAAQQLMLGECDVALGGGVSESIHTFGIYAGFQSQNALAHHADPNRASRPFDRDRNGIVIAEGGALFVLERYDDARKRGAKILFEVCGWAMNTDATDFVLPNPDRQAECMALALRRAGLNPDQIGVVSTHATGTKEGDIREIQAIKKVFGERPAAWVNNAKSFWGHAMGAAGALELAGNLPSFADGAVHPTINVDNLDPACAIGERLVVGRPCEGQAVSYILNNSFGMLGVNAALVVGKV